MYEDFMKELRGLNNDPYSKSSKEYWIDILKEYDKTKRLELKYKSLKKDLFNDIVASNEGKYVKDVIDLKDILQEHEKKSVNICISFSNVCNIMKINECCLYN